MSSAPKPLPAAALKLMLPWWENRVGEVEAILTECLETGQEVERVEAAGRKVRWTTETATAEFERCLQMVDRMRRQFIEAETFD